MGFGHAPNWAYHPMIFSVSLDQKAGAGGEPNGVIGSRVLTSTVGCVPSFLSPATACSQAARMSVLRYGAGPSLLEVSTSMARAFEVRATALPGARRAVRAVASTKR